MRWGIKKRSERRWGIDYYLWIGSRDIRKKRLYFEAGDLPKSEGSDILLSQYEIMSRPVFAEIERSDCKPSKSVERRRKLKAEEADNVAVDWSGRAENCCWLRQTKLVVVLEATGRGVADQSRQVKNDCWWQTPLAKKGKRQLNGLVRSYSSENWCRRQQRRLVNLLILLTWFKASNESAWCCYHLDEGLWQMIE